MADEADAIDFSVYARSNAVLQELRCRPNNLFVLGGIGGAEVDFSV